MVSEARDPRDAVAWLGICPRDSSHRRAWVGQRPPPYDTNCGACFIPRDPSGDVKMELSPLYLDAADPLRALLPEVVEVLELAKPPQASTPNYTHLVVEARRWVTKRNNLLTRLQALTTDTGDDDEIPSI